jgi:hypothetical protein
MVLINDSKQQDEYKRVLKIGGTFTVIAIGVVLIESILMYFINGYQFKEDTYTAIDWFNMIDQSRIVALIDKGIMDVFFVVLLFPLYITLYSVLETIDKFYARFLTLLVFVGFAAYFSSNTAFTILFAADVYKYNPNILTSAEGLQSISKYGMYYCLGFLLVTIANIIINVLLMRNNTINKLITITGLVGNSLILANYISFAFIPTTTVFGTIVFPLGGGITLLWYLSLGIGLILLSN